MKEDRFLLAVVVGIGLLAVLAVVLFLARQPVMGYLPEDSPQNVVFNYTLALQNREYERAYGYLLEAPGKPDFQAFRQAFQFNHFGSDQASLRVGGAEIVNDEATGQVSVIYAGSGFMGGSYRSNQSAFLTRQEGQWKIQNLPQPFWCLEWYQDYSQMRPPLPLGED